jgi:hypothetical protein
MSKDNNQQNHETKYKNFSLYNEAQDIAQVAHQRQEVGCGIREGGEGEDRSVRSRWLQ